MRSLSQSIAARDARRRARPAGMRYGALTWPDTGREYVADVLAHAVWLGFAVSVLVHMAGQAEPMVPMVTYGACLVALVLASTANNMAPVGRVRDVLSRVDRAVIYPFIAATCGAFLALGEFTAWKAMVLAAIWAAALVGVCLKVGFPGRFSRFGIALYLGLGWVAVLGIADVVPLLGWSGTALLFAGGLIYSAGVPVYLNDALPYRAFLWHVMCLGAGICHFAAIVIAMR